MRHAKLPHFKIPWHFHPEIEIMYIIKGEGTRYVGDSVQQFCAGDFVLVGPNIPHLWRSHEKYYKEKGPNVECLLLFFREESFGSEFLSIAEMANVKKMLVQSKQGIRFCGPKTRNLKRLMIKAFKENGVNRVVSILHLLGAMSQFDNPHILCSPGYFPEGNYRDYNRLDKCLNFLLENYQRNISLKEVADMANMTPNSFCRYFKKRTTMTFSRFLIELRIGKTCQLLMESDKKIIEIAFECGFASLSNFNGQFAGIKKMSPRQYRKKLHNNSIPDFNAQVNLEELYKNLD
tara:strand:+ start:4934 stop:5806 length:873 start_codon:yes stop_codon:yes gene_type:complete